MIEVDFFILSPPSQTWYKYYIPKRQYRLDVGLAGRLKILAFYRFYRVNNRSRYLLDVPLTINHDKLALHVIIVDERTAHPMKCPQTNPNQLWDVIRSPVQVISLVD
jgi:hypothetical protein